MFFLVPLTLALSFDAGAMRTFEAAQSAPVATLCQAPTLGASAPALWVASNIPAESAAANPLVPTRDGAPLELWRADDGLFYVYGAINGHDVRFVVDTGASMVVLTASDAQRAGVEAAHDAPVVEAQTAAGKSAMTRVTLSSMRVGNTGVAAAPAVIAPDGLGVSLLGQSWLSQLASVTIEGDRMTLR